ncbi:MAG: MFS transporter [Chloroflexota bacterium]|nr:MFS transporter [Chloroflexota bacterium]
MSQRPAFSRPPLRSLFRIRDYRVLWVAALCMIISQMIRFVAIPQWFVDQTGGESFTEVAIIGAVQLPIQAFGVLYGGVLADRFDRRWLMASANAAVLAILVAVATAATLDLLEFWMAWVALGALGGLATFVAPARATITPRVVPPRYLSAAVTLDTSTQMTGWILGGLIVTALAVGLDAIGMLWVAAGFALISAIMPALIKTSARAVSERQSTLRMVIEGTRYVIRHPILPGLFILDWGITVISYYREILPLLATGLFMAGVGAAGALGTVNAVGSACGMLLALFLVNYRAKGIMVLAASAFYAALLFALGAAPWLWVGMIVIAMLGAADAVTVAVRQVTVHLTTPDEMRGRAFSVMVLMAQTANNLGIIWVGFWGDEIGVDRTYLLGGVIGLGATLLIGVLWRSISRYRAPDHAPDTLVS